MNGPWLQSAVLCEHVTGDEQGRAAAVGCVEGVVVDPGEPLALHLVIAVVRGDWRGTLKLHVDVLDPAGARVATAEVQGDPPAIPYAQSRIAIPVELVPTAPGVYWLEVQLAGVTATRVPLRVDWRPAH